MKKIVVLICFFASFFIYAQDDKTEPDNQILQVPKPTFWDNVYFGGGIGLGFAQNSTTINISPGAIYDFQNGFALGVSFGYLYSKIDDFKSNVFTPGIIALYNPAEKIQLSAQFEHLFVNQTFAGSSSSSFDYSALYLGVAYRIGWAAFGVRYDVLFNERDSIFVSAFSPIVRIYF